MVKRYRKNVIGILTNSQIGIYRNHDASNHANLLRLLCFTMSIPYSPSVNKC